MTSIDTLHSRHLVVISLSFIVWKAILGLVAYNSPGIGYDTSSSLLEHFGDLPDLIETPSTLQNSITKFIRWDAVYFTQIAARNYVFEQEWAFSFAFARIMSVISRVLRGYISLDKLQAIALSGVLLSHLSHLCSVYVLYFLTKGLYANSDNGKLVALCAALLHTLSPAGVFLSAPYTESLFSLLNITGFALYLQGMNRISGHATPSQRLQVVIAGLIFGFATIIRSNGLLSGLPFLYDAVARSWAIANHGFSKRRLYDLGALVLGGMLVLSGLLIPQIFAYRAYCMDSVAGVRQPWCTRALPSIYAWVQERYWVNGFLRYWTISNIPLFLLAAPMLLILSYTAFQVLWPDILSDNRTSSGKGANREITVLDEGGFVRLAIPQLVLAVLAFFVYNVQIITRLSSGYPLWYIWLAEHVVVFSELGTKKKSFLRGRYVFRFMIMYAIIQGGLFASFLPPA